MPDEGCGEGADGCDAIEIVDWDTELLHVIVGGVLDCELHYTLSYGGVEEADAD